MTEQVFAVGSYTDARWGDPGAGVSLVALSRLPGGAARLRVLPSAAAVADASYLVAHRGELIATSEQEFGELARLRVDSEGIHLIERRSSGGAAPCHLAAIDDEVVVSHYSTGDLAAFEAGPTGLEPLWRVREIGTGPRPDRQEASHVHSTAYWQGHLVSANLGTDELTLYRRIPGGPPVPDAVVRMPAGSGPRHLQPVGDRLYITGELDSSLHWVRATGRERRHVGSFPSTSSGVLNHPSHLAIVPGRPLLVLANRGADTLAVFDITQGDPLPVAEIALGGRQPRHFAVTHDYLLVAEEASSRIELVDIRSADARDWAVVQSLPIASPACIIEATRR